MKFRPGDAVTVKSDIFEGVRHGIVLGPGILYPDKYLVELTGIDELQVFCSYELQLQNPTVLLSRAFESEEQP
jgi:hypothetical protein